ncbi:ribosomal RNA small subunit methyltransferase, chloroplastic [Humulus lupulus]|uniref:ribosomal RNA small subunit methyltransferase, chloroplastic n=1 Tax=Humulus lupulus TaxID=3486 RepID=UPI002B414E17|nr:ribosomal RNA small subunit methyltransferase, chloroplastic [Humulus lupulus]
MTSPLHLLQYLPPISIATTTKQRLKPSLPLPNNPEGSRRPSCPYIKACSRTRNEKRNGPDDYHAILKALNSKGRFPRKSLGQHYMLNSEVNEQLSIAAEVKEGDLVLEIGPGTGSLTNVLINAGAYVLAIEKDPHMAALVSERFAGNRFKVISEDFLKCHIRSHVLSIMESAKSLNINSRYAKVVSNLPFNISTDVVKQLLPMGDIFSEVVLLLQEETALRLVESSLGTPEYRPINISVNFYSDPEFKFKVPRTNFFPQPNVDAAVVTFRLKRAEDYPSVTSTKSFFSMINSAFNGKRKMLRKSLQHLCSSTEIENALGSIGLPATSRPGELTVDDFVKLHNLIMEI